MIPFSRKFGKTWRAFQHVGGKKLVCIAIGRSRKLGPGEHELKCMGPRASGSLFLRSSAPLFPSARTLFVPLSRASLRSLFLVKPTDKGLGFGIYLPRRVDTAVAFYKVSRADRRESCTRSWTGTAIPRALPIIFFHLKLNFVLQFLITRRISGSGADYYYYYYYYYCYYYYHYYYFFYSAQL